jgi:hypothetical protein
MPTWVEAAMVPDLSNSFFSRTVRRFSRQDHDKLHGIASVPPLLSFPLMVAALVSSATNLAGHANRLAHCCGHVMASAAPKWQEPAD